MCRSDLFRRTHLDRLGVVVVLSARAEAQLLGPPLSPNQIVVDATNVLAQSVAMPSGLPQTMLAEAQGIAIVPNMVRGAFVIGVQHGRGVLLTRGPGGAWQAPRMIQITGGSFGYQIGVQSTDLILDLPHAAERGERAARHAEGRRRCVGRGGAGGSAGVGGDRFAAAGGDSVVLAGARRVLRRVDRRLVDLARSGDRRDVLPTAGHDSGLGDATGAVADDAFERRAAGDCRAADAASWPRPAVPERLCRSAAERSWKRRGSNSTHRRANWRPVSTTNGSNTSRCRRRSTFRITRRASRRSSRRSAATKRCRSIRSTRR